MHVSVCTICAENLKIETRRLIKISDCKVTKENLTKMDEELNG